MSLFFKELGFRYHQQPQALFSALHGQWSSGQVVALIGPNGAGKSSLFQRIAGVYSPRQAQPLGQVLWKGQNLDTLAPAARAQKVAYLGARLDTPFPLTVAECVALGQVGPHLPERVQEALGQVGAQAWSHRSFQHLSMGEHQRILLARAWVQGAELLLLDETLNGLDLRSQQVVAELLQQWTRKQGKLVFWITHDLWQARAFADQGVWLQDGQWLPPQEIIECMESSYWGKQQLIGDSQQRVDQAIRGWESFFSPFWNQQPHLPVEAQEALGTPTPGARRS